MKKVTKGSDLPRALKRKSKYFKILTRRISSKTAHLEKPDNDKKIISRLKAQLKLLAFKFRSVFDSSRSYYIILDKEMSIIDFKKASTRFVKKLFGTNMVTGDNILNFLHPSSTKIITEWCDRAFAGEKFVVEKRICGEDKNVTWWSFEFSPANNLRGDAVGLVFNANDITKRKAYEEKIGSQHKKLVDIAASQSHEIRGPVSTIMGLMSLIKNQNYEPEREYLLLLEITADILDKNVRDIVKRANDEDLN